MLAKQHPERLPGKETPWKNNAARFRVALSNFEE
jgi:hypothetical protein